MVTDPIGDFIIRLQNAGRAGKKHVAVPYSQLKFSIAQKLEQRGFLKAVSKRGKKARKVIEVEMVYSKNGSPRIDGVARISKPGRRVYSSVSDIYPIRNGKGALIISTPKGVLTGEEARKEHVGGETLFKIW